ncbi:MAG: TIGR04133 family radical SAM/SPASM protein [Bacteroidales bacterium]|nr:TIGR04133 family radical SAM/SPASM protein [Bacteroidales bacterium]
MNLRQRIGLELHRMYRHNNAKLHPLQTLFWECTLRCNANCRHCGSDCKQEPQQKDMPAEDFLHVIDTEILPHVDPHKTFIIFTGGEALVRQDIEEVGLELYRREFPWGMVTNGYLLDEARLDSLMRSGIHSMTISLDGLEEAHNWLRRNPQSFQRATHAIQLLSQERDLLWDIVTCVNPRNVHQLEAFKEYILSLGVRRWRVFTIVPMGRAATDPELQLSPDDFHYVFDFIKRTRQEGRIHVDYGCEGFLGDYEQEVRDHWFYCRAGIEVASILCDGSISGCTSIRSNFHQGNIYNDSFWDVWQNRFEKYRHRDWTRKGACGECKLFRYCEGSGLHLYDDNEELRFCHYHRLGF